MCETIHFYKYIHFNCKIVFTHVYMLSYLCTSLSLSPPFLHYSPKITGLNPTQPYANQQRPDLLALQSHYEAVKTPTDILR
jgi:hypothetical protein